MRFFLTASVIYCCLAPPLFAQLQYGPYIQNTAHDRATVVWYTKTVTTGILRYGSAPGNWQNEITVAADSAHFVEVTGLAAKQRYYYEVADPATIYATGNEYYFDTHPEIGCTKPFTFAAMGDIGTLDQTQFDVAARLLIERNNLDAVLLLGDIIYSAGQRDRYKARYFDVYKNLIRNQTWWPTLGNHDIREANGAAYLEFFVTPANNPHQREHYYSFDYGSAHIVSLDNEIHLDEPQRSEQLNWLRADLQDAVNRGQRWLIAIWHEAPYSGGTHTGDGFAQRNYVPILDQYGADLVLAGHSHVLERSYLLVNGAIANAHPNEYTKTVGAAGAVYVVSGAGGELEDLEKQPNHPLMAFQRGMTGGYAVINVNHDTLSGHFLTTTGQKLDGFRIIKTGLPPIAKQPVFAAFGNFVLAEGDTITHEFNAAPADTNSPTTMTISGLPSFASFTDLGNGRGRLKLTPDFNQSGSFSNLKITAENSCAASSKFFSITVNEVTDPPLLQAVGDQNMNEGTTLALTLSATDPNGDALTFLVEPLPPFATLTPLTNGSAQLGLTPNYQQNGVYPLTITVTDGHAKIAEVITLTVNDLNRSPQINGHTATPDTVGDDASVALQVFASDPDLNDSLSYLWQPSAGNIIGAGASVTFVPPIVADTGAVTITVEVNDGYGGIARDTMLVHVFHVNRVPVANAGVDQAVSEADTVYLDGSASSDFDPQTLSYRWRQVAGAFAALSDSQAAQPYFIAPRPGTDDRLLFELIVHDGLVASAPDTVVIAVNTLPNFLSGIIAPRDTIHDDTTLTLRILAQDENGDSLRFSWHTSHGSLSGADSVVTFTPPVVTDTTQVTITAFVNDGRGGVIDTTRQIIVHHVNRVPIAVAGDDLAVAEGDSVFLDGSASSDFDPQPLQIIWRQLTGTRVTLSDSQSARPFFIAPRPDTVFNYLFELVVNDGVVNSAPDTIAVLINALPHADAGADQLVSEGETVMLHGELSNDLEGQPLQYRWRQLTGVAIALSDSQTAQPQFLAPRPLAGAFDFLFELTVNDGKDDGRPDTTKITINALPIANAGADQFVTEEDTVTLDGSASHDLEGQPLAFRWRQLNTIGDVLSDTTDARPQFIAQFVNNDSSLFFELRVHDGIVAGRLDTVEIHLNRKPRIKAWLIAPPDTVTDAQAWSIQARAHDADLDSLTFTWAASIGALTGADSIVSFQPPIVSAPTPTRITLEVSDGRGGFARDTLDLIVVHPNRVPVAVAGFDQFVTEGDTVYLDGSASHDFENSPLQFIWRQRSGEMIELADSTSARAYFIAPRPTTRRIFDFLLIVKDGVAASAPDTVAITINRHPLINGGIVAASDSLGDDATLALSANVTDADNDSLTYVWSTTFGTITGAGANAVLTPPIVVHDTIATVTLRVNDGRGGAAQARRSFTIYHVNRIPLAHAGVDQAVREGATVMLDGSASSDFENSPLQFRWRQVSGVSVAFSDSQAVQPSFIAPAHNGQPRFAFELVVDDGSDPSLPDTVEIVINNLPVLHNITAAQDTMTDDDTLALQAHATDAEGDSLLYYWTTSFGTITGNGAQATFAPVAVSDAITATIRLRVEQINGGSARDSIFVVIVHGNDPPTAHAGADQIVTEGVLVHLDASASSDPENDPLVFHWRQLFGPQVTLYDSLTAHASFYAVGVEADTEIAFELIVEDGELLSAADTVRVLIKALVGVSEEITFTPLADATTRAAKPAKNYGLETTLDLEAGPVRNSYLKFRVTGLTGPVQRARLRLHAKEDAPFGGALYLVNDTTWNETVINFNNAPAHAATEIAHLNEVIDNTDYDLDVSAVITGNGARSFVLRNNNATPMKYSSREGSHPPLLIVTYGLSGNIPPTIISGPIAQNDSLGDDASTGLSVNAIDLDGDSLQYSWSTSVGQIAGSGANAVFDPPNVLQNTSVTITVQVTDGKGGASSATVSVIVLPVDEPPVVNAGIDQNVLHKALVQLNGSGSYDPDGAALQYAWQQIDGPRVTLSDSTVASPTFVAPTLAYDSLLRFSLRVFDGISLSAPDTVSVSVAAGLATLIFEPVMDTYVDASVPNTNYGKDWNVLVSKNPQRTAFMRYHLTGFEGKVLSAEIKMRANQDSPFGGRLHLISNSAWRDTSMTFSNAPAVDGGEVARVGQVVKPQFYVWNVTNAILGAGIYNFALLSDTSAAAKFATRDANNRPSLIITYEKLPSQPNQKPVANAGAHRTVSVGANVVLNGSASSDPEGAALQYLWRQIAGEAVALSSPNEVKPTFVSPNLFMGTILEFELRVFDGMRASLPDTVRLTVPAAERTATFSVLRDAYVDENAAHKIFGSETTLRANASPDRHSYIRFRISGLEGEVRSAKLKVRSNVDSNLGGAWHLISNSTWGEATVSYNTAPEVDGPQIAELAAIQNNKYYELELRDAIWGNGIYNFALLSNGGLARYYSRESTSPPELTITYGYVPNAEAQRPIANAGADLVVNYGDTVALNGSASSDPQNDVLQYYWMQIGGTMAALSSLRAASTTFIAPTATGDSTLTFQLQVWDGKLLSAPDTVKVRVIDERVTLTFRPTIDAYTDASTPSKNYGTLSALNIQGTPLRRAYLRFNVSGINGRILAVKLRLRATMNSAAKIAVHQITDNAWTELGLKHNNAPSVNAPEAASLVKFSKGRRYDFILTEIVTGDGVYNFALLSSDSAASRFAAREASNPPELIVEYWPDDLSKAGTTAHEPVAPPKEFQLGSSYPNPFSVWQHGSAITLNYGMKAPGRVRLEIYNALGQFVRAIVNEDKPAGYHTAIWHGRDKFGQRAGTGVYIYRIEIEAVTGERFSASKKLMLVK